MIVDTSALLAVVFNEPDEPSYAGALVDARRLRMSVANWIEAAMVIDSRANPMAATRFEDLVARLGIELVPVSVTQARKARIAHQSYGRGNHRAKLNYGDCFAYALANETGEPLLFKGLDFAQTDIEPALKD